MADTKVETKQTGATQVAKDAKIETFEIISLDRIGSDPSYQRYLSMNYVQQLIERWDPRACGPLLVSRRKSGALFIIDGQHRLEALKLRGETQAMARVANDLTEAEEARIRIRTQFVKPERAWERFKARLAARDPEALQIVALLHTAGATVQLEKSVPRDATNMISSVRSVENIFSLDKGVTLTSLVNLLIETHGEINKKNSRGVYLRALGWFLFKHPNVDRATLVKVLRQDWESLETRARSTRSSYGSASLWTGIYQQLTVAYNKAKPKDIERLKYDVTGSTAAMGSRRNQGGSLGE